MRRARGCFEICAVRLLLARPGAHHTSFPCQPLAYKARLVGGLACTPVMRWRANKKGCPHATTSRNLLPPDPSGSGSPAPFFGVRRFLACSFSLSKVGFFLLFSDSRFPGFLAFLGPPGFPSFVPKKGGGLAGGRAARPSLRGFRFLMSRLCQYRCFLLNCHPFIGQ